MKIVFKDLGQKKFSKIVEVSNIIGYSDILEFLCMETMPHMPEVGCFEFVATDGKPDLLANQYVVVHNDSAHVSRGMGTVIIYP